MIYDYMGFCCLFCDNFADKMTSTEYVIELQVFKFWHRNALLKNRGIRKIMWIAEILLQNNQFTGLSIVSWFQWIEVKTTSNLFTRVGPFQ